MADLVIKNASQLISLSGADKPRSGVDMEDLKIIENGCIAIVGTLIEAVGIEEEVISEVDVTSNTEVIDATQKIVMPGFVDSHTHPVFANTREDEFELRLKGKTYMEIAAAGGGIRSSVRSLRMASKQELVDKTLPYLDSMLEHGTTTIEAKSGYGLSTKDEIKTLEAIDELNKIHPVDLVPTFLGAHDIPDEHREDREAYVQLVIDEMLPQVVKRKLAEFCDIFCEEGVFTPEESRRILTKAKEVGLRIKMHADEFAPSGGAEVAAELGAVSADHLGAVSDNGIKLLKENGVIATLLPGTLFFLGSSSYARARWMIDEGLPVALATDFNPGSSMTNNMQLILTIACAYMKMTPAEVITASTVNGAYAVGRGHQIGTIEAGKQADLSIYRVPNYKQLPYYYGVNHCDAVIKKGKVVYKRSENQLFSSAKTIKK